jgi:hypothetical protein
MTDGDTGTAWQRHHSDGLWHSTAGKTMEWQDLWNRYDVKVLVEAPARAHDDHEVRYIEENITRSFKAIITSEGDIRIDPEEVEIDFMTNTTTHVWCMDCQRVLSGGDSGLSDDWQVL